jgi:HK97 family phage prohead protease
MTLTPEQLEQLAKAAISGRIGGYASAFGVLEPSYGTMFDRGAFKQWLKEHRGDVVPIYYWHEIWGRIPIGRAVAGETVKEDDTGLHYEADILDTEEGNHLLKAVAVGAVNSTSHSFRAIDRYQKDEIWHFKRVDLVEISPTPKIFAANPGATVEIIEAPNLESSSSEPARMAPMPASAEAEALYQELQRFNREMRK